MRGLVRAGRGRTVEGVLGVTSVPIGNLALMLSLMKQNVHPSRRSSFFSYPQHPHSHPYFRPYRSDLFVSSLSNFTLFLALPGIHRTSPHPLTPHILSTKISTTPTAHNHHIAPAPARHLSRMSSIRAIGCASISSQAASSSRRDASGTSRPAWGKPAGFKRIEEAHCIHSRHSTSDSCGTLHYWHRS